MSDLVLTPFRGAHLDGEARREEAPARPRRVFVDREGRVVVGDDLPPAERRRLSEIPPAVFA
jgi:hypothetical protein